MLWAFLITIKGWSTYRGIRSFQSKINIKTNLITAHKNTPLKKCLDSAPFRDTHCIFDSFLFSGSFDSLKATFTLKRRTTYFIFQLYIPSAFVVFLSWLSFWVDRHAVPARISLVITCILSTMFLFESTNSSLPRISYLKAVDHYLITSFVFIVSCMVEYVCVLNFPDKSSAIPRSQSFAPVSLDRNH